MSNSSGEQTKCCRGIEWNPQRSFLRCKENSRLSEISHSNRKGTETNLLFQKFNELFQFYIISSFEFPEFSSEPKKGMLNGYFNKPVLGLVPFKESECRESLCSSEYNSLVEVKIGHSLYE